ncbi:MAG: pyridoxamine 5'-phosphate oxidase family protein [Rubrivivax sp.]
MNEDPAALLATYPEPGARALKKQLGSLDPHCLRFIALSPFVVLATGNRAGQMDASPRGGVAGFVKAADERTLLIPDASGNNRLDSLRNIIDSAHIGLLFMVPGVEETLRVNGAARLSRSPSQLQHFADEKKPPRLVIEVTVHEAYLHCAKAFMRSRLWEADKQVLRSALPSMGQMISDQTGSDAPAESQAQMRARYAADL